MLARVCFRTSSCSWQLFLRGRGQLAAICFQTKSIVRTMSHPTQPAETNSDGNLADSNTGKDDQNIKSFSEIFNLKSLNFRLTEDSTVYCAKVIHPGLSSESFEHYGHPSIISILKTASRARIYAMNMPVDASGNAFVEYDKVTTGPLIFFASSVLNIFPPMYDISIPKWPLEVKVQCGYIGRTSMTTVTSMTASADPERRELMNQVTQMVLIDRATRRPKPFPDWWREKYQGHCVQGVPLIIKRQDVPESGPLSMYEVKVAWSDTDVYNHTNFTSYVRFAVDAVHDAHRLGKLGQHLTAADLAAGISQLKMAYLGESVEGDRLKVLVWPFEECNRCIVCSLEKEGQVINQVTVTFFSA